jgi:hypothetical protein
MPEVWVLLLVISSNSPVASGVVHEVDRFISLAECKGAAARALVKAPGADWVTLNAQWACIPGQGDPSVYQPASVPSERVKTRRRRTN